MDFCAPTTRTMRWCVLPVIAGLFSLPLAASSPPNLVVIFIDDLGYADIGLTGDSPYQLPHLDRLVREGMAFTDFVSSAPVCSASRAALLTGCYHRRVGIAGALGPKANHGIHEQETTLAELCRTKGYATACFGKWHLGHHPKFLPLQHGFDEYLGLPYSNDMWPQHPHFAGMPEHEAVKRGRYPALPMIEGNRVVDAEVTAEDQALLTRRYTERAVAFIRKHEDRPFFLYLPHSMVHVPLFASDRFLGQSPHGIFGDVMREVDWSVGEILKALDETGHADDTLVIFSSDNGPWLTYGDHAGSALPLREGKGTTFEGGVRVPTVMRWPKRIAAGSRCDELCGTIDVLPTVAELLDADLPDHPIDGKSIVPLLNGKSDATSPHEGLCYYYHGQLQAVRDRRWKLHFPHQYHTLAGKPGGTDGRPVTASQGEIGLELFDLTTEIGERTNVAAEHPEVVARLQAAADRVRAQLGEGEQLGPGCRTMGQLADQDQRLVWAAGPTLCIGNHHSESDGIAQLNRFRATFQDLETWQRRAAATRRQLLQQSGLEPMPPRTPLNPIVRNRRTHDGYTVESVSLEALPGFLVYGSLYRPASTAAAPCPGVLSVHGHWGEPNEGARFRPDNQLRCATLARMGAVVLGIDMIGYGESARHGWKHHHDQTMLLQLWSNHRAVDFLCSLDEVDPKRLAVTGASGGGTQTVQLALTDDRIQVSAPVCMVSAHFFGGCICESGAPVYLTSEHETNLVDMAAAFAPKPQLLISVGGDWSCNTPDVEYPYLREVYELWGAADAVANAHFADEGHDYGSSKRQALYDFFAQHLGLNRKAEDENAVVVESADEMCVFDKDHPLPDHALAPNQWPHVR